MKSSFPLQKESHNFIPFKSPPLKKSGYLRTVSFVPLRSQGNPQILRCATNTTAPFLPSISIRGWEVFLPGGTASLHNAQVLWELSGARWPDRGPEHYQACWSLSAGITTTVLVSSSKAAQLFSPLAQARDLLYIKASGRGLVRKAKGECCHGAILVTARVCPGLPATAVLAMPLSFKNKAKLQ